jgi:hypothetical protein
MTTLTADERKQLIEVPQGLVDLILIDVSVVHEACRDPAEKHDTLYPHTGGFPDLAMIGWKLEDGELIVAFNFVEPKTRLQQWEDAKKQANNRKVSCVTFGWIDRGQDNFYALTQTALREATRLH